MGANPVHGLLRCPPIALMVIFDLFRLYAEVSLQGIVCGMKGSWNRPKLVEELFTPIQQIIHWMKEVYARLCGSALNMKPGLRVVCNSVKLQARVLQTLTRLVRTVVDGTPTDGPGRQPPNSDNSTSPNRE